ncbi:MAG: ribosome maturation factor RimM, partial [Eubacteriales bacterium]|nr:ribosome maturation factor RimM [Eubacteriales bacterium]
LRDAFICVDRAHTVKLPPDTWFVADLIGCRVYDSNGSDLGTLTDVLETGANDVYEVHGEKLVYLPALKKLLLDVDVTNKRILVDAAVLEEVGLFED